MVGKLVEIFSSWQGEGEYLGTYQLFFRFAGCNLHCSFCDTKYAWRNDIKYCKLILQDRIKFIPNPVDSSELKYIVDNFFCKEYLFSITLTGGEPLLQYEFIEEFILMISFDAIYIETNGTLSKNLDSLLDKLRNNKVYIAMDMKLPSLVGKSYWAAHEEFLDTALKKNNVELHIKLLISDSTTEEELEEATNIVKRKESKYNKKLLFILQPYISDTKLMVSKEKVMNLYKLAALRLDKNKVRFLPQLHKLCGYL